MAQVSLKNVKKSYGDVPVIHGIDMAIDDGEFIVIVGPSGCGKSTLLRMIAGLEVITEGDISIGGAIVNDVEPKDRNIAMVFQNYALYPHMSVYGNMAYGLKIRGMSKQEIDNRVKRAAEILQLEELLRRQPRQLSGGQRQRVAMGRAIVREPAVYLFDEPLSNLDAKLRVQMRVEIRKLHQRLGVTSIYVTHDQVEAMTLADRLIVMNQGLAEQIGTPMDVYDRPATTYVAGFIGSPAMNFLATEVSGDGNRVSLPSGEEMPLLEKAPAGSHGSKVLLGIRPEHLTQVSEPGPDRFHLQVDLAEALGADTLVHGRVGDADIIARMPGATPVRSGESIIVEVAAQHVHLFDIKSGKRL